MGSITFYSNGLPVTMDDRTYSWDETLTPVDARAYKTGLTLPGAADVHDLWRKQSALRMVTTFLADNIAQVPIHAFLRQSEGSRVRLGQSDPLARVLSAPDAPRLTRYDWIRTLVLDVCLYDRYAAQIFVDSDGFAQIVRLPPSMWRFTRDSTNRPKAIEAMRADGSTFPIQLDRSLWIDGYPSDDDTSPIQSLRGILDEAELAGEYRRSLWRNGGRFPGWITRPANTPWTVDARDRFRSGWAGYSAGGDRSGRTPILEDGMDYHEAQVGVTPETGQQLESRKLSIAEVANAFHVPPQMVGQDSGSSYNSVSGYRELLYADTLGTWFERLDGALNMRLVPQVATAPDVYCEFAVQSKLRLAFEDQARIFQTSTGAPFMTRAEARARLNLPHIEGTDQLIVPLNVLEGGQASPTDSGSQNIGGN